MIMISQAPRQLGMVLCTLLAGASLAGAAHAAGYREKLAFSFNGKDGGVPNAGLIADASGNLYGTTSYNGGVHGYGNVYELTRTKGGWKETDLYDFTGGADGAWPLDSLVFDAAGNLYGTAESGGQGQCVKGSQQWFGCGVVFELSPSGGAWQEKVLFSFVPGQVKGIIPVGGLVFDGSGNLYGTTWAPGVDGGPRHSRRSGRVNPGTYWGCSDPGCGGTVFELSPTQNGWQEQDIYAFTGTSDGGVSQANLVFDAAGNLYGTTVYGGNSGCVGDYGCGVVFELSPGKNGWGESVLHAFSGSDGANPQGSLTFDGNGNVYSTTEAGGASGDGTVFELLAGKHGWTENLLHSFTGTDGANPFAGVIIDAHGNLFGTTNQGGNGQYADGTAFELSPSKHAWKETLLHTFAYPDAQVPAAPLLALPKGRYIGTAQGGGNYNFGAVFELGPK
ncbi:MAG TPA: choice-of-anchor tandem repeat GloVer-containing protein [Rhizomicrobium sp.]|nr:choice-of-anchor tandem repeat GloVer-containing protein [Rhizomicrobium sp.]